jgi:hypothetical protein
MSEEKEPRQFLPCMEQPPRCFLTCTAHPDKRLSNNKNGRVVSSNKRSNQETFVILPQGNDVVMIQSFKHNGYLRYGGAVDPTDGDLVLVGSADANTFVSMTLDKNDASLWCLEKADSGVYVTCMDDNTFLACNQEGNIILTKNKEQTWNVEFQTGELCFVSSPAMDRRVRCDLMGSLTLSENWKGWEVWRFIEADGEGHVRLNAWMHPNHYLCSNAEGEVYSTTNPQQEEGTKWAVEQDSGGHGVIIRSALHDRLLCCSPESLFTDPHGGAFGVWQLEAAHRQMYTLSSSTENKSIGPFPLVTDRKSQVDEWELEKHGDNISFFLPQSGRYLGSTTDGEVSLTLVGDEEEVESWKMVALPGGGCSFRSTKHKRYLAWKEEVPEKGPQIEEKQPAWLNLPWKTSKEEKNGVLCTVLDADEERAIWRLEPCMPRAVSSKKIKTFAIGTAAAVATTVAMPFAVAGVVGLIGAEVGILADIVVVGLTGAEAIESVVVVGTTAALCFKASGDSYGSNREYLADDEKPTKSFAKRPFAAIGSGKALTQPDVL